MINSCFSPSFRIFWYATCIGYVPTTILNLQGGHMSAKFDEQDMLIRFADNMKVMVATLDVLDKSTRGEMTGEEAMAQLDIIKEKFYTFI